MGRARHTPIDGKHLRDLLVPWLEKKKPGFSWSGTDYQRLGRNQAPDKTGLKTHEQALLKFLQLAPAGFPGHTHVRQACISIDEEFDICCIGKKSRFRAASEASDCWRKMLKDCVAVKRSANWPKELDKLMAAVGASGDEMSVTSPGPGQSPTADPDDAEGADDASDVELVKVICKCPECMSVQPPKPASTEAASSSSTARIPIPPPQPGEQLRQTLQNTIL